MALMMSVSGVRGIIGQTLTPELAADLGAAFGSFVGKGPVVIGRDSRPTGEMIKSAVLAGLIATGCDVVDLGIVTTPGVAVMVSELRATGGIVITASHNPIQWNGIKFLTDAGSAPPADSADKIFSIHRRRAFAYVGVELVGRMERDLSTADRHVDRVLRIVDASAIRRRQLTVVLDSVNGAGGPSGRMLLERLGCRVAPINQEPNGQFAHPPEPTEAHLTELCQAVRENGADVGFAQDPDADRLAIVDNTGRYIGEEYTLALAARFVLGKRPGAVAANLSTSRMVDDVAAAAGNGACVVRTAVGEANVVEAMRREGCVLGGEGNGGVIDPRVVFVRDSLTAMGQVLGLMAEDWRPLAAIVDELPRYAMIKQKFDAGREETAAWLERVRLAVEGGRIDTADGLRVDWPEGWVHVRPSNTEPIARVIAEAADEATALSLAKRVTDLR